MDEDSAVAIVNNRIALPLGPKSKVVFMDKYPTLHSQQLTGGDVFFLQDPKTDNTLAHHHQLGVSDLSSVH